MFKVALFCLLTFGITFALNDGHAGQEEPSFSALDLPDMDEDADVVEPTVKTIISFPLNIHDRTLRIVLFKNSADCTNTTETLLNGQDFKWLHTKEELLSCYDEPYLGRKALVAADKTNGGPLFLMFKFSLNNFDYSLEPASEQLVGCRGSERYQLLSSLKMWGKTHYLFNVTKPETQDDSTTSTELPSTTELTTSISSSVTTTPAPPLSPSGLEWQVVYGILLVVLVVMLVVLWVKRAKMMSV